MNSIIVNFPTRVFWLNLLVINIFFVALGLLFLRSDHLIPYYDLKLHVTLGFELIDAVSEFDIDTIYRLMASSRPPGSTLPLIPFFFFLPVRLENLQFLYLLFYGNVFVIGMALLGRELFPEYPISWFFILPASTPLLWSLTLRPYYDIAPLALTPWLFYTAALTQRFQRPIPSLILGVVLALFIVFRSYGAYICIVFIVAFGGYLMASYISDFRQGDFSTDRIRKVFLSLVLASTAAILLAYVPATGILSMLAGDIGSTSYLWNQNDALFYLRNLLELLGGATVLFACAGIFVLATRSAFARLLVTFFIILFLLFQFGIQNQDFRYAGAMAAISVFSASAFLGWLSKRIPQKMARAAQLVVAVIAVHQLVLHLFNIESPVNDRIAELLHHSKQPLYLKGGNEREVILEIFESLQTTNSAPGAIYVGKDTGKFNYSYLDWIQDHEKKIDDQDKLLIYFADVPRFHGIPEDFLNIDYILVGQSVTPFNKWLYSESEESGLLPNFLPSRSFQLETRDSSERLKLLARARLPSLKESIEFQRFLVSLDADNLRNIEQYLWLYKVSKTNLIGTGHDELAKIAWLIPSAFAIGNIDFSDLEPLCLTIPAHLGSSSTRELEEFCSMHGIYASSKRNEYQFSYSEYDKSYSLDWLYMTKVGSDWIPLISHRRMVWEKWSDRKWGALSTDSLIGFDNKIAVNSNPVAIFWVAPDTSQYTIELSMFTKRDTQRGEVSIAVNNVEHFNGLFDGELQLGTPYTINIWLNKGDTFSLILRGKNLYCPKMRIARS